MTRKSRMLVIVILAIIFNIFPDQECCSEESKSLSVSSGIPSYYIKKDSLVLYDREKILDFKRNGTLGDSMETLLFSNKLWFLFCSKSSKSFELFNIDMNTKKIKQVTHRSFNKEDDRLFTVKVYNNKLYVTTNFRQTDHMWDFGMLLIDEKNDREERFIPVKRKSFLRAMNIRNDSLYIIVEPNKAILNPFYFISFWMKRERPEKYDYTKTGECELFVYDRNFVLRRHSPAPKCK